MKEQESLKKLKFMPSLEEREKLFEYFFEYPIEWSKQLAQYDNELGYIHRKRLQMFKIPIDYHQNDE